MVKNRVDRYHVLLLGWIIIALAVAQRRSFWCDELVRYDQTLLGLAGGIQSLLSEPSPFAPGEIVLNWLSKSLFGSFLPPEIWGRLPGVVWGGGTLYLSILFARAQKLRFLPWLAAFSVSVMWFSVLMRPYGALLFAGALALHILWNENSVNGPLIVLSLLFTHIYGVCYIAFSCLLRKRWLLAIFGAIYVIVILMQFNIKTSGTPVSNPAINDIIRQIAGTLGNPHKASYLMLPLFVLGIIQLAIHQPRKFVFAMLFLGVSVIAPTFATLRSNYFFVPRQEIGGLFLFLVGVAIGLEVFYVRFTRLQPLAYVVFVVVGIFPWCLSTILRRAPFPDQPLHKTYDVLTKIYASNTKVLNLDACQESGFMHYGARVSGNESKPIRTLRLANLNVIERCWDNSFCVYSLRDGDFCSYSAEQFEASQIVSSLNREMKFDYIVYTTERFPGPPQSNAIRLW